MGGLASVSSQETWVNIGAHSLFAGHSQVHPQSQTQGWHNLVVKSIDSRKYRHEFTNCATCNITWVKLRMILAPPTIATSRKPQYCIVSLRSRKGSLQPFGFAPFSSFQAFQVCRPKPENLDGQSKSSDLEGQIGEWILFWCKWNGERDRRYALGLHYK